MQSQAAGNASTHLQHTMVDAVCIMHIAILVRVPAERRHNYIRHFTVHGM